MSGPLDPFIVGLGVCGCMFGPALGALGWVLGYNFALRKVASWMRPQVEAHGDAPIPPYGIAADDPDQTWGR